MCFECLYKTRNVEYVNIYAKTDEANLTNHNQFDTCSTRAKLHIY